MKPMITTAPMITPGFTARKRAVKKDERARVVADSTAPLSMADPGVERHDGEVKREVDQ